MYCDHEFERRRTGLLVGLSLLTNHNTRDEMLAAFGPFAVVFEPMGNDRTPYLSLLHLNDERTIDVVRSIRNAVAMPGSAPCVLMLLRDVNWRPHLVGIIAAYYETSAELISQMWAALDAGSWATPQIAGILFKCDRSFTANAVRRLNNLCPISGDPDYSIDSPIERHSAQGPSGSFGRSSKAAASLLAFTNTDVQSHLNSLAELHSLVAEDVDDSAEIALAWLERFLELDAEL